MRSQKLRNRRRSSRSWGQVEHTMCRLIQSRYERGRLNESLVDHSSATTTVHFRFRFRFGFRFPLPAINIDTVQPICSSVGCSSFSLIHTNNRRECRSRCSANCNSCRCCCCCCWLCATGAAPNCVSISIANGIPQTNWRSRQASWQVHQSSWLKCVELK